MLNLNQYKLKIHKSIKFCSGIHNCLVNEIGVTNEFLNNYKNIIWFFATQDVRSSSFYAANQSNVDFWVYIWRAIGLNNISCNGIYQDEKSGMDMFRHSTRGSIGLLSYDENGNNIQTTNNAITSQALVKYNLDKIRMIAAAAKADGVEAYFTPIINQCLSICFEMQNKNIDDVFILHKQLQDKLWIEMQCDPEFKRSISFIFIKQIVTNPASLQEQAFSKVFQAHVQEDKLYNLDKKQDFSILYKAMIYAGKEVDPQFVKKLEYLHNNGLPLNNNLLSLILDALKHGL